MQREPGPGHCCGHGSSSQKTAGYGELPAGASEQYSQCCEIGVGVGPGPGDRSEGWGEAHLVQTPGSDGPLLAAGCSALGFGFVLGVTAAFAAGNPNGLDGSEAAGQHQLPRHERTY